jgi:hypothetical protein
MIFFFFLLGLQEIFFRNLPTPPPSKIKWSAPYFTNILFNIYIFIQFSSVASTMLQPAKDTAVPLSIYTTAQQCCVPNACLSWTVCACSVGTVVTIIRKLRIDRDAQLPEKYKTYIFQVVASLSIRSFLGKSIHAVFSRLSPPKFSNTTNYYYIVWYYFHSRYCSTTLSLYTSVFLSTIPF